jgi:hypothetical protein
MSETSRSGGRLYEAFNRDDREGTSKMIDLARSTPR